MKGARLPEMAIVFCAWASNQPPSRAQSDPAWRPSARRRCCEGGVGDRRHGASPIEVAADHHLRIMKAHERASYVILRKAGQAISKKDTLPLLIDISEAGQPELSLFWRLDQRSPRAPGRLMISIAPEPSSPRAARLIICLGNQLVMRADVSGSRAGRQARPGSVPTVLSALNWMRIVGQHGSGQRRRP